MGGHRSSDDIPKYLSSAEKTFETTMNPFLLQQAAAAATATAHSITIEDLREIAVLEHKLALLKLEMSLWTTYLRSGTGKLIEDRPATTRRVHDLSIWPKKLKSMIKANSNVDPSTKNITHDTYLNYVHRRLDQFREQTISYQTQLTERKQYFNHDLTLEMEKAIENFVEHYGITLNRIVIEGEIAFLHYDYKDRLIESHFYQQTPDEEQVKIFKNLIQSKFNQEKSKMEVAVLKQSVAHHYLSSLFDSFPMPPPPSALETIEDQDIQQRLTYRYQQLIQRTKSEMISIHIRTAEVKMEEKEQKFERDMQQFNQNQQCPGFATHEKFTIAMSDALEQRFNNIDERLETFYNLKVRFFVKAPTVVNKN